MAERDKAAIDGIFIGFAILGAMVGGAMIPEGTSHILVGIAGGVGAVCGCIMGIAAVIGAVITLAVFDVFIIVTAAFGGAGLAMDGLHLILPGMSVLDRTAIADGATLPLIVWVVAGTVGMAWQFKNIGRWVVAETQHADES